MGDKGHLAAQTKSTLPQQWSKKGEYLYKKKKKKEAISTPLNPL